MSNPSQARAWVDIGLGALRANYETLRRVVGDRRAMIPMVKADGYGLGAERVVRALEPAQPWGYGVAAVDEGLMLRHAGVRRPIVVFCPLAPQAVETAAAAGLVATISDIASIERWAAAAERHGDLEFHVEIDTGMGRAGFDWRETTEWAPRVLEVAGSSARWSGVYTHFHSADSAEAAPTITQWERFRDAVAQLPVMRETLLVHAANSAAALRWEEVRGDAVRPGIFLYGGGAVESGVRVPLPASVAGVRARVVHVRNAPPGSTTGYAATHIARGWERWATLAIGYGDGLRRSLGNRGQALIRGTRVPIVGRISMDMTVVEVTAVPDVAPGDVATLLGRDGESEIRLDDAAAEAGTIAYEILTGLTPRLPRVER